MANKDAPFGFIPVRMIGGAYFSGGQAEYDIGSTYGTNMFTGDVVELHTDGTIVIGAVGATNLIGVFNGCFYTDPTTSKPTFKNYWPASVAAEAQAFVYDNPDDLFEVQATGILVRATVSRACDMAYTTGATINGRSKEEISVTAGADLAVRVVRISGDPANSDIATANANWIVKFNEHIYYNYST